MTTTTNTTDELLSALAAFDEWRADAACGNHPNPDLWHENEEGWRAEAQKICATCPVRMKCLEYALETQERHGIWGGLTTRKRDDLRRAHGDAA